MSTRPHHAASPPVLSMSTSTTMPDHELPKYSPLPNKTADDEEPSSLPPLRSSPPSLPWRQLFIFVASATVTIALIIQLFWLLLSAAFGDGIEHGAESPGTKGGKDYYQTSPELYVLLPSFMSGSQLCRRSSGWLTRCLSGEKLSRSHAYGLTRLSRPNEPGAVCFDDFYSAQPAGNAGSHPRCGGSCE